MQRGLAVSVPGSSLIPVRLCLPGSPIGCLGRRLFGRSAIGVPFSSPPIEEQHGPQEAERIVW
jgi:hypothetical protein